MATGTHLLVERDPDLRALCPGTIAEHPGDAREHVVGGVRAREVLAEGRHHLVGSCTLPVDEAVREAPCSRADRLEHEGDDRGRERG